MRSFSSGSPSKPTSWCSLDARLLSNAFTIPENPVLLPISLCCESPVTIYFVFSPNLVKIVVNSTCVRFCVSSTITHAFGEIETSQSVNAYKASIVILGDWFLAK